MKRFRLKEKAKRIQITLKKIAGKIIKIEKIEKKVIKLQE